MNGIPTTERKIDVYFRKYTKSHQNPVNKLIHWICVPFLAFSLLGLVWAIPMPHVNFLGKMNGYINLATFLILFSMLYYIRLSVRLAFAMGLTILVFSAGIITLEKQHRLAGWPDMWEVCAVIFVLASVGQFIGDKLEGNRSGFFIDLKFLLIGPVWLWYFIFKKLNIRF